VCRIKALWRLHCCGLPRFGWGRSGSAGQPKFLPPSFGPRFCPELREAGLAASRGDAVHPHPAVCWRKALPVRRVHPALLDGKQPTAVCRIKALWRLHCCGLPRFVWGRSGSAGQPKFLPPSPRPQVFPKLREAKHLCRDPRACGRGTSTPMRNTAASCFPFLGKTRLIDNLAV